MEIKTGLDATKELDWPPSLGEFMKYCKSRNSHIPAHRPYIAELQKPKSNPSTGNTALSRIRDILKKNDQGNEI